MCSCPAKYVFELNECKSACPTDANESSNICKCTGAKNYYVKMTNSCAAKCPENSNDNVKSGICICLAGS